jgi:hypothetical protein
MHGCGLQVGALQTSHSVIGLSAGLRDVVRMEGVRALWKGNGVTMMHRLPYTATNFYLYEQANQALSAVLPTTASGTTGVDSIRRLLAGGFAGSVACTVVRLLSNPIHIASPSPQHDMCIPLLPHISKATHEWKSVNPCVHTKVIVNAVHT